jgi:hypothetical protein
MAWQKKFNGKRYRKFNGKRYHVLGRIHKNPPIHLIPPYQIKIQKKMLRENGWSVRTIKTTSKGKKVYIMYVRKK